MNLSQRQATFVLEATALVISDDVPTPKSYMGVFTSSTPNTSVDVISNFVPIPVSSSMSFLRLCGTKRRFVKTEISASDRPLLSDNEFYNNMIGSRFSATNFINNSIPRDLMPVMCSSIPPYLMPVMCSSIAPDVMPVMCSSIVSDFVPVMCSSIAPDVMPVMCSSIVSDFVPVMCSSIAPDVMPVMCSSILTAVLSYCTDL
ncbi:hypothetical protein RRG08_007656 [Elysia crispata]|uniref:Uncharacterized protein n=1 Tax=Elysia crispata TaxID=231223 RepID=A0AAE0Y3S6_9GAST|nr:hypothetical protein RRG08_007656 [Elysia crispata]